MIDLLVDIAATHRLVRLATADDITAPPRDALIRWAYQRATPTAVGDLQVSGASWTEYAIADADAPKLAVLASCRWCASTWCAFGVVALRRLAPRLWSPVATALALSSASTLLAGLED